MYITSLHWAYQCIALCILLFVLQIVLTLNILYISELSVYILHILKKTLWISKHYIVDIIDVNFIYQNDNLILHISQYCQWFHSIILSIISQYYIVNILIVHYFEALSFCVIFLLKIRVYVYPYEWFANTYLGCKGPYHLFA